MASGLGIGAQFESKPTQLLLSGGGAFAQEIEDQSRLIKSSFLVGRSTERLPVNSTASCFSKLTGTLDADGSLKLNAMCSRAAASPAAEDSSFLVASVNSSSSLAALLVTGPIVVIFFAIFTW